MHEELVRSLEKVKSIDLAKKHLIHVEKRLQSAIVELEYLNQIVEQEHQQYEELEKAGIRKIFRNLLGKGEETLDQEKQDYLEAVLKYNQQLKEVDMLEFEQKVLKDKLRHAPEILKEHQRKVDFYSEQIAKSDTSDGKLMRNANRGLEKGYQDLKEVNEALKTGQEAERAITKILDHLKKSGWWGERKEWKNMIKKVGAKLEHIDKARKLLPKANLLLNKFMNELGDIYAEPEKMFRFNPASFEHFTNGFYDSLITDYILKQKAENAIRMVAHTHDKIKVSLQTLGQLRQEHEQSIRDFKKVKNDILMRNL